MAYAQKSYLNVHAEVFSWVRCLNFDVSLHLHHCFVYVSSKGSGELICYGIIIGLDKQNISE